MYLVDLSWVNCAWNFRQSSSLTRICASNSRRKSKCSFSVAWTKKEEYLSELLFQKVILSIKYFFPQSCPQQDLLSRNVLGLSMRMFPPQMSSSHLLGLQGPQQTPASVSTLYDIQLKLCLLVMQINRQDLLSSRFFVIVLPSIWKISKGNE